MSFNGTNQYGRYTGAIVNTTTFTISARVKPSTVTTKQSIVMRSNYAANNVYYGILLSGNKAYQISQNNTAVYTT